MFSGGGFDSVSLISDPSATTFTPQPPSPTAIPTGRTPRRAGPPCPDHTASSSPHKPHRPDAVTRSIAAGAMVPDSGWTAASAPFSLSTLSSRLNDDQVVNSLSTSNSCLLLRMKEFGSCSRSCRFTLSMWREKMKNKSVMINLNT